MPTTFDVLVDPPHAPIDLAIDPTCRSGILSRKIAVGAMPWQVRRLTVIAETAWLGIWPAIVVAVPPEAIAILFFFAPSCFQCVQLFSRFC